MRSFLNVLGKLIGFKTARPMMMRVARVARANARSPVVPPGKGTDLSAREADAAHSGMAGRSLGTLPPSAAGTECTNPTTGSIPRTGLMS